MGDYYLYSGKIKSAMSVKNISVGVLLFVAIPLLRGQNVEKPNFALKSHETLEISRIETDSKGTVFHMSVENRIPGGSFCADRNIWIILSPDKKLGLVSAAGIPVCPDAHHFIRPGEKLEFTLVFPPLPAGTGTVDLIEDCSENCFSFYGIVVDNELNSTINMAFEIVDGGNREDALKQFIQIAEDSEKSFGAPAGLLYINIIQLAAERGYQATAEKWYRKLRSEDENGSGRYIEYLNTSGIKY